MAATSTKTRPASSPPENGGDPSAAEQTAEPQVTSQGAPPEQVLTVNTLAPKRPYVVVDDVRHDLRLMQEFGEREHQEFSRDSDEYDRLWNLEEPSDEEHNTREKLVDSLLDRTLRDANALREQLGAVLTGPIKRDIVLAFSNAPSLMELREAMAREQARRQELEVELEAAMSAQRS